MSQKEVIKSRIRSVLASMSKLRIEYSSYEDQLSDLRSDLLEIERKEIEDADKPKPNPKEKEEQD